MAIDATRGLPSFSEMLTAFRNKGSLADTLKAGLAGYEKGVGIKAAAAKEASEASLRAAQAEEAKAKAESLRTPKAKRVPLAALPETIKPSLAPYVDSEGMVPEEAAKVALGTTKQGQDADAASRELKLREDALAQRIEAAKKEAELRAEINRIREESGAASRELNAAKTVAETTGRMDSPPLLEKAIISPIKEALTGDPTAAVLAQRQNKAAMEKLAQTGGITPQPQAMPAPAPRPSPNPAGSKNPLRNRAIQELQAAGAPVTEANIQEAIRQLGGQ